MAQIRNEIYDDNGLVEVQYIEVEDNEQTQEELISQKETELVRIYNELQQLKDITDQTN